MKYAAAKKVGKIAWNAAKPRARAYLQKNEGKITTKTKNVLSKGTDRLVDRGADKIGLSRSSSLRGTAKKYARKGVGKGVDVGMAYAKKKLA